MTLALQQRKIRPMALMGKVFALMGASSLVVGALLGGYTLLVQPASMIGLVALIFAGLGLLELLVGLMLWLFAGDSPAGNVVSSFYSALARQDYMAAFEYLTPGMQLSQGQTPEHFIESAQAVDASQGLVTDYRLRGVQANPTQRVFTMKVTRGGRSYRTRLYLEQQGGGWKIAGLDRL